jgi:Zn-dependent protease
MDDFILRIAIGLPGFLLAIVFHEWGHAYVAYMFGDDTAKRAGRLSLNPVVHLDILGTVIFPLVGALLGGVMFGWAKPVPIDPRRFKNIRYAIFWVAFAGPGINLMMALISAFLLALVATQLSPDFYLMMPFLSMLKQAVYINIILAVFNLVPFPPLDGSKMVSSFLSYQAMRKYEELARFSFLFFIVLMYTGGLRIVLTPALLAGNGVINLFYQMLA